MRSMVHVPILRHQSPVSPESRNAFISPEWCLKAPLPLPPLGRRLSSTVLCENMSPEYSLSGRVRSLGSLPLWVCEAREQLLLASF